MRYLAAVFASCLLAAAAYLTLFLGLSPAPIAAEYWVREMIVVKRGIARAHENERKLIVAGGSATLFGVDSAQLGRELGVPALNFGLHAALPLARILEEAGAAANAGDGIILALEPEYYCDRGPTAWQVRAAIAWNPAQWHDWSTRERIEGAALLGPGALLEVAAARVARRFWPGALERRLAAFDDARILARIASAQQPTRFAYSAYHLDALGNMRGIEGSRPFSVPREADRPTPVCEDSIRTLRDFVSRMRGRGVAVRFAHAPRVASPDVPAGRVEAASQRFVEAISVLAPVLDSRRDAMFPRTLFFNTALHLNARGRALRTRRLAEAIRRDGAFCAHLGASCST